MGVVHISANQSQLLVVNLILRDIQSGNYSRAARSMIENAITFEQIRKNYAELYNNSKLPDGFVKAYKEEYRRVFGVPFQEETGVGKRQFRGHQMR